MMNGDILEIAGIAALHTAFVERVTNFALFRESGHIQMQHTQGSASDITTKGDMHDRIMRIPKLTGKVGCAQQ